MCFLSKATLNIRKIFSASLKWTHQDQTLASLTFHLVFPVHLWVKLNRNYLQVMFSKKIGENILAALKSKFQCYNQAIHFPSCEWSSPGLVCSIKLHITNPLITCSKTVFMFSPSCHSNLYDFRLRNTKGDFFSLLCHAMPVNENWGFKAEKWHKSTTSEGRNTLLLSEYSLAFLYVSKLTGMHCCIGIHFKIFTANITSWCEQAHTVEQTYGFYINHAYTPTLHTLQNIYHSNCSFPQNTIVDPEMIHPQDI